MKIIIIVTAAIGLFACNQEKSKSSPVSNDSKQNNTICCSNGEYLSQSVLWFQHSPEMQAFYVQSYNIAKVALASNLKNKCLPKKKNAVVVDIDETILNNSRYQAWLYLTNNAYSDASWNAWVRDAIADPLPGTVDFLKYAQSLKCEVFYVSNRVSDSLFASTLQNLKKFHLPFADEKHLLLKEKSDTTAAGKTTKEKRRLKIENQYMFEILLLCGDQLGDFDKAFDATNPVSEAAIKDSVTKYKTEFGTRFIVLPNPMYGEWLKNIVSGKDKNYKCEHQDTLRRNKAINWK